MFRQTAILTAVLGLLAAAPAQAAIVTLSGSTVNYTFNDSLLGLFGTPSISGNTLYFTPINFYAQSLNGAGYSLTRDTVNVQVSAKAGYTLDALNLQETGDYQLLGRKSNVNVGGQIRVFSLSQPLNQLTDSVTPTAPLNLKGSSTHDWTAVAGIDLTQHPSSYSASPINVTLENLLTADTLKKNTLAYIEKKSIGLDVITSPVPEVKDWALMLAGLGLVGLQMRRRTRADGKHIQPGA